MKRTRGGEDKWWRVQEVERKGAVGVIVIHDVKASEAVLTWEVRRAKSMTVLPVTPKAANPMSL